MYYGGYSNDFFYVTPVYACSGYARVQFTVFGDTTNCPFTNQQLDINFWNDPIVEAVDGNNGECVGKGNANGLSTVATSDRAATSTEVALSRGHSTCSRPALAGIM
jgi:hypothetical protein